jgi:adenine-specific DNA-methyltransferase
VTVDLRLGDCLEILPTLEDNSVDLILTDPPYYKVKGDYWDRQWDTPQGFLEWLDLVLAELYRVMKPNGSLYLFASPEMSDRVSVLIRSRFNVLNTIRWVKEAGWHNKTDKEIIRSFLSPYESILFAENYGAEGELYGFLFEPIRKYLDDERIQAGVSKSQVNKLFQGPNVGQYWWQQRNWQLPTKENYEILREGLSRLNHGGKYLQRDYDDLRAQYAQIKQQYEDLRRPFNVSSDVPYTDVWTFKTVSYYLGKHPCEKPLDMLEHMIKASSKEGATVLDCFMGTGNTGRAAQKLGRSFIGVEKDAKYFERAKSRIETRQMELV